MLSRCLIRLLPLRFTPLSQTNPGVPFMRSWNFSRTSENPMVVVNPIKSNILILRHSNILMYQLIYTHNIAQSLISSFQGLNLKNLQHMWEGHEKKINIIIFNNQNKTISNIQYLAPSLSHKMWTLKTCSMTETNLHLPPLTHLLCSRFHDSVKVNSWPQQRLR